MTRPTFDDLRAIIQNGLLRGKRYADTPGTGPEGTTCKTCAWLRYTGHGPKWYPKCGRTKYTRGDATTIKVRSPSCRLYEPQPKKEEVAR